MLRLRPYKKCDAKVIVGWIKDEVSFRKWCADRYEKYPICDTDMNDHYEEAAFSDSFFPMTAFDETGIVGHQKRQGLWERDAQVIFAICV